VNAAAAALRIETGQTENRATTSIFLDGVDILLTSPRVGSSEFLPPDPTGLLPPDSRVLLASAVPSDAMIGTCTCGVAGCGSLWMRVRRDGGRVLWEPHPRPPRSTIDRPWIFQLGPYLDAIDAGTASMLAADNHGRRMARALRQAAAGLWGPHVGVSSTVVDARGRPGVDAVSVRVLGPTGSQSYEIPVADSDDVNDVLRAIRERVSS
jgi:hypothetical protein